MKAAPCTPFGAHGLLDLQSAATAPTEQDLQSAAASSSVRELNQC